MYHHLLLFYMCYVGHSGLGCGRIHIEIGKKYIYIRILGLWNLFLRIFFVVCLFFVLFCFLYVVCEDNQCWVCIPICDLTCDPTESGWPDLDSYLFFDHLWRRDHLRWLHLPLLFLPIITVTFRPDEVRLTWSGPISLFRPPSATRPPLLASSPPLFPPYHHRYYQFQGEDSRSKAIERQRIDPNGSLLRQRWQPKPLGFCSPRSQQGLCGGDSSQSVLYKENRSFEIRWTQKFREQIVPNDFKLELEVVLKVVSGVVVVILV